MNKIIRARVIAGRFKDQIVRISNVSVDEMGRKKAACSLPDGTRANIPAEELELIPEEAPKAPEVKRPKTSMPFISGAASSRTMTQTKNMAKLRPEPKKVVTKESIRKCEKCGQEYNMEARKGEAGKLTECENCAHETETKVEGTMIFSHKTGATIEIKKDGELLHEADTFDPKNKT
ncbi:MAG: hypothetical protein V4598_04425 [Bdellovibrionota bacterium]